ncbi:hypothetical protein GE21DRAFT_1293077 [Neurospora crassa]|nr:hypothetical protein GE21DRAFT_1293077 [Neurospora crassa]
MWAWFVAGILLAGRRAEAFLPFEAECGNLENKIKLDAQRVTGGGSWMEGKHGRHGKDELSLTKRRGPVMAQLCCRTVNWPIPMVWESRTVPASLSEPCGVQSRSAAFSLLRRARALGCW